MWVNRVILALVLPIYFCVVAGFIYSFVAFRRRDEQQDDPAPVPDDPRTQRYWIVATAAVAVFLWAFGTYEWIWAGVGSGGGQGPVPLVRPERTDLEVQVIGQQWAFTYRYPSYGGMESPHLVLPEGQTIEMHVTSLDVIHSFWAVELGAKADAVPGFDNVLDPRAPGGRRVRDQVRRAVRSVARPDVRHRPDPAGPGVRRLGHQAAAGHRRHHEVPAGLRLHVPARSAVPRQLGGDPR